MLQGKDIAYISGDYMDDLLGDYEFAEMLLIENREIRLDKVQNLADRLEKSQDFIVDFIAEDIHNKVESYKNYNKSDFTDNIKTIWGAVSNFLPIPNYISAGPALYDLYKQNDKLRYKEALKKELLETIDYLRNES